ncbi:hypothetical protein ACFFUT_06830 [Pseudohalocynthiibacter aestuariivivens]|uniref:DUF502 domain-containing protein n=1 Tax=Pseudohalocynthiibacter aestuariivivens TaxID=1591409 RepID=A0ABV5JFK1_9RHOB|nr:hypothetical protein [Pseudohalocynthiibacter aestuariivivens]MBS9719056.1 hypothetical protein [Pseudohalocynthiibacter aestuariivivens]
MKTTILGGILFLVPLAFIAIVLGKAFEVSMLLAQPLDGLIPLDSLAGIAMANIIAIVLILAICFAAGLAAKTTMISKRVGRLDDTLIDIIPGYAVARGIVGGIAGEDDTTPVLSPVLVRFDDFDQLAFEVERMGDRSAVFLPGSPSAWSGTSVIVDVDRVVRLDLPPHQAISLLRVMGRGMSKIDLP